EILKCYGVTALWRQSYLRGKSTLIWKKHFHRQNVNYSGSGTKHFHQKKREAVRRGWLLFTLTKI
ncbi:MAG: hypothetical protein II385_03990, partial [Bacteroidaceae bacterium]|nr:hypothetical protein [Bacteroidaceae bacterium]